MSEWSLWWILSAIGLQSFLISEQNVGAPAGVECVLRSATDVLFAALHQHLDVGSPS